MLKFIAIALVICCAFGVFPRVARLRNSRDVSDIFQEAPIEQPWIPQPERQEFVMDADFQPEEQPEPDRYIYVEGRLYRATDEISDIEFRCGMMDGSIESSVEPEQLPGEEGQSNFGAPYGYQYGEGGNIELLMDRKWMVFEPVDEPENQ